MNLLILGVQDHYNGSRGVDRFGACLGNKAKDADGYP